MEGGNHTEAYERLADQVTADEAASVLAAVFDADARKGRHAATVLAKYGMLPVDWTLFHLTALRNNREAGAVAVAAVLDEGNATITPDELLEFAVHTRQAADWTLSRFQSFFHGVTDRALDQLVTLVALELGESVDKAVELTTYRNGAWVLSDVQGMRLAEHGSLAALVVATQLGRLIPELVEALLRRRHGVVILSACHGLLERPVLDALLAAVDTRPDELRHAAPQAALRILNKVAIPAGQGELLLDLVVKAGNVNAWLAGVYAFNAPTSETVAIAVERGLVDGEALVRVGQSYKAYSAGWFPGLVTTTSGVVPPLLEVLGRLGGRQGAGWAGSSEAHGIAVMLQRIGEELGDDVRLWERMLSADKNSPFANLSVAEAAAVYRTRWAEEKRRKQGFDPSDFRTCATKHDPKARHPRSICPTERCEDCESTGRNCATHR